MVALTLITIVLAALFSSWGFVGRSTLALSQYNEMNSMGRTGLEIFARDVRRARKLEEDFSSTDFRLVMEEPDESLTTVRYSYDASGRTLIRREGDSGDWKVVFRDVDSIDFSFYGTTGAETIYSLETRLIQLELLMARDVQGRDATKKIVSARYIMRNKQHGS